MVDILNLKIYTPDKLVLNETILKLSVDGKEGNFSIMPKHIDYISSFSDGIISYTDTNNAVNFLAVNQGVLVKTGRNIEISTFHVALGTDLKDLKNKVKELALKSEEIVETDKKINISLKKMEYTMLQRIMKFRAV